MKRLAILAAGAMLAMLGSTAAMARVDVDISIGVPGFIYSEPDYYYPPVRYAPPRVIVVPERRYRQAYSPRYYRESYYRGDRHYKKHHKHHNQHRGRGHRDRD